MKSKKEKRKGSSKWHQVAIKNILVLAILQFPKYRKIAVIKIPPPAYKTAMAFKTKAILYFSNTYTFFFFFSNNFNTVNIVRLNVHEGFGY